MKLNNINQLLIRCEQYKLLAIAGSVYYHETNTLYKPGDLVHPTTRMDLSRSSNVRKVELAMEKVRQKYFPDRPSRIDCVFVSPSITDAVNWAHRLNRKYYYKVGCDGQIFLADGDVFSEAYSSAVDNDPKELLQWCIEYWKGGGGSLPEIIVQGKVTIIEGPFDVISLKEIAPDFGFDPFSSKFIESEEPPLVTNSKIMDNSNE